MWSGSNAVTASAMTVRTLPRASRAARVRADRVHVAQDRVEALVGAVPESIHVIGEPGQSSGERRREDIDLSRGVDDRADDGR